MAFASHEAGSVLTLDVFDVIGADLFGEGVTTKAVAAALATSDAERIRVRINSPGGDAFEGLGIQSLLRADPRPVDVEIHGLAASAASVIAMAGDTVSMGEGAVLMIHDPWSIVIGGAEDMRKEANVLDTASDSLIATYMARATAPESEIRELVAAETWLSAERAIEVGLADKTISDDAAAKAGGSHERNARAQAKFRRLPEAHKSPIPARVAAMAAPKEKPSMKIQDITKALGLDEDVGADSIVAAIVALSDRADRAEASLKATEGLLRDSKAETAAAQDQLFALQANAAFERAQLTGVLTPPERKAAEAQFARYLEVGKGAAQIFLDDLQARKPHAYVEPSGLDDREVPKAGIPDARGKETTREQLNRRALSAGIKNPAVYAKNDPALRALFSDEELASVGVFQ